MSLILWNAGLLGGLRRYGEFGMRLAIGEGKSHVYKTMLLESLIIGFLGSLAGIIAGMGISFYLQRYGIDLGSMMKNASIMMPQVFRAPNASLTEGRLALVASMISFSEDSLSLGRRAAWLMSARIC